MLHLTIMWNLGSNLDNLKHFSAWQSALARQEAYLCNSQVTCSFKSLSFSRGSRCAFNSLLGRTSPLAKVDWIGVIFNKILIVKIDGNYKDKYVWRRKRIFLKSENILISPHRACLTKRDINQQLAFHQWPTHLLWRSTELENIVEMGNCPGIGSVSK